MMGVQLKSLLTLYFVYFELTSALPQNPLTDQVVTNKVNDESEVRENLQNLFNSVAKQNAKKSDTYHEILKQEITKERQAFDTMNVELRIAQNRNAYRKRNFYTKNNAGENVIAIEKREAKKDKNKDIGSTLNKSELGKLSQAVKQNDMETLKRFIEERQANLLSVDEGHLFAQIAAKNGHSDIVKYLMEEVSFTKSFKDSNYKKVVKLSDPTLTLLDEAIFAGSLDLVKYIVEKLNVSLYEAKDCERTMLTIIAFDRFDILKYFIEEKKVDVKAPCKWLSEPLIFMAVRNKHRDIIDYLIKEKKVNLEERNFINENILYPAAEAGDVTFMRHLLDEEDMDFGVNRVNRIGQTPVYAAVASNQMEVLQYLVDEKEGDVNIPDYRFGNLNTTCLHKAVADNNYKMCEYLIDHGARIEDVVTYGRVKNAELIKLLNRANATQYSQSRSRRSVDLFYL